MAGSQHLHKAPIDPDEESRGSKVPIIAIIVVMGFLCGVLLYFWLVDVDSNVQGGFDVPNVYVNPAEEPDPAGAPAPAS